MKCSPNHTPKKSNPLNTVKVTNITRFISRKESNLSTQDEFCCSIPRNISLRQLVTFLVINESNTNVAEVLLELSPDGKLWVEDNSHIYVLKPQEKLLLVPEHFLRYARIKFRSHIAGHPVQLTIWYQGQG